MNRSHFFQPKFSTLGSASLLGFGLLALTSVAHAQYGTNFDSLANTQALSTQDGWNSNDNYTGSSYNPNTANPNALRYIGNSDGLTTVPTYSANNTDQQAFVGGAANFNGGEFPGRPDVYVFHPTSLPANSPIIFSTDYIVTAPAVSGGMATDAHDGFGWSFRNAGGANLFSINFVTTSTNSVSSDNVSYTLGTAAATAASSSFTLGSRYRLSISVTGNTFSASYIPQGTKGGDNGTRIVIASNVAFTGTVATVGAVWNLANATSQNANGTQAAGSTNNLAYTLGGSNVMLFDNVSIVPEPSTYIFLGFGLIGTAAMISRRRVQKA